MCDVMGSIRSGVVFRALQAASLVPAAQPRHHGRRGTDCALL